MTSQGRSSPNSQVFWPVSSIGMGHRREYILSMDELSQVDKREEQSQEIAVWFFGISVALMVISIFASIR